MVSIHRLKSSLCSGIHDMFSMMCELETLTEHFVHYVCVCLPCYIYKQMLSKLDWLFIILVFILTIITSFTK